MSKRRIDLTDEESLEELSKWFDSMTEEENLEYAKLSNAESDALDKIPCLDDESKDGRPPHSCPFGLTDEVGFGLACYTECKSNIEYMKAKHAANVFASTHGRHICDLCSHRDCFGVCELKKKFRSPLAAACEKYWQEEGV